MHRDEAHTLAVYLALVLLLKHLQELRLGGRERKAVLGFVCLRLVLVVRRQPQLYVVNLRRGVAEGNFGVFVAAVCTLVQNLVEFDLEVPDVRRLLTGSERIVPAINVVELRPHEHVVPTPVVAELNRDVVGLLVDVGGHVAGLIERKIAVPRCCLRRRPPELDGRLPLRALQQHGVEGVRRHHDA